MIGIIVINAQTNLGKSHVCFVKLIPFLQLCFPVIIHLIAQLGCFTGKHCLLKRDWIVIDLDIMILVNGFELGKRCVYALACFYEGVTKIFHFT